MHWLAPEEAGPQAPLPPPKVGLSLLAGPLATPRCPSCSGRHAAAASLSSIVALALAPSGSSSSSSLVSKACALGAAGQAHHVAAQLLEGGAVADCQHLSTAAASATANAAAVAAQGVEQARNLLKVQGGCARRAGKRLGYDEEEQR